ncbi:hypothetical protein [Jannaschia seohaensis]|uniref:hypothetical protein n=1 Tax=Jannaschia seohaensis TaxID=475081 RepID=UPI000D6DB595|nr:hypothetical protein [Jannaschia seohaensis]
MAYFPSPIRIRGLALVVFGTLAAALLVALAFATGLVDLGLGAPTVRIDAPGPSEWPRYPE